MVGVVVVGVVGVVVVEWYFSTRMIIVRGADLSNKIIIDLRR